MSQKINDIIDQVLSERKWNKDSKTPRDYSKEYNPPGSKEQEERNKRKRDKRKHDKLHGECPAGEECQGTEDRCPGLPVGTTIAYLRLTARVVSTKPGDL